MSDPIERLREDARRAGGVGHERPDLSGSLARIHERASGFEPGGLTRQKRARVGAWGVAGVGAVAAAGLAVSGVLTPDGGSSPQAAPPTAPVVTPRAVSPQGGATAEAVAYVSTAQKAFRDTDLADMVVVTTSSGWIKHPGEKKSSNGVYRDVDAGDGHATRWTILTPMKSDGSPDHKGTEELKVAVPGREDGRMTYWYIDPVVGVYATFPLTVKTTGKDAVPSIPDQIAGFATEIHDTLAAARRTAAEDGVTTTEPAPATVDGRAATCISMTGTGDQAILKGGPGMAADRGRGRHWTWRVCFDPQTRLPVLSEYGLAYQLPQLDKPSHSFNREAYAWLPKGPASEKLFAPHVDGLRKVSRDQYFALTK